MDRGNRMTAHRGRRVLAMAIGWLATGLVGCQRYQAPGPGRGEVNYRKNDQRVFFGFSDPSFDDKGPGRYTYPLIVEKSSRAQLQGRETGGVRISHPLEEAGTQNFVLDTRSGFFDVTRFEVVDGGSNVIFEITTRRPIPKFRDDGSSEAKGWFLQLMDIYIDKDGKPGSGRTRTIPGRNLEFPPDMGWEQAILVSPQERFDLMRLIEQTTSDLDFVEMRKSLILPDVVFVEGYTFRVLIPKGLIGEPQPHWGYQCFMMLFDPGNLRYGQFQQGRVQRYAGNNVFGGGDEYGGHPNVIDILAPTPDDQYQAMRDFVSSPNRIENRFAIVPMIYGEKGGTAVQPHQFSDLGTAAPGAAPGDTDTFLFSNTGLDPYRRQPRPEASVVGRAMTSR